MPSTLHASATHDGAMVFALKAGDHHLISDYPLTPGAAGLGPRPLELLLASLCACLGGSLVVLLKKDGQAIHTLRVRAEAQRRDAHPTVLESADLVCELSGPALDEAKVQQALKRSEELICPIWAMLKPGLSVRVRLQLRSED